MFVTFVKLFDSISFYFLKIAFNKCISFQALYMIGLSAVSFKKTIAVLCFKTSDNSGQIQVILA